MIPPRTIGRPFLVLFAAVFSAMLGLGIIVPLLPVYATSLGASGLWVGLIFSSFALARAVFMPIIGSHSDMRGRRKFIIAGLALYMVLSLAYLTAWSVEGLVLVRFFHGIASAMVIPVAMAYVADMAPEKSEGTYMGLFSVSMFLGMGIGPLLGGVLLDAAGMDEVFLSMFVFSAVSLAVCLLFLPESAPVHGSSPTPLREVLKSRKMQAVFFFRFSNAFATAPFLVFFSMIGILKYGLSASEVGIVIAANILAMALLQGPFGKLADSCSKPLLILTGSAVAAAGLFAIPFLSVFSELFTLGLMVGAGNALALPAATAVVAIGGRRTGQGSAMGAFNMAMSLGMFSAPVIFGIVMDTLGLDWIFWLSGIIAVLSMGVFWGLVVRSRRG